MKWELALLLLGALARPLVGCGAPTPAPAVGTPPSSVADTPSPQPRPAPAVETAAAPEPARTRTLRAVIQKELDAPVRRLAIDRAPHLAALSTRSVWIHDAKGWREEALPASLAADETLELDVFYGRDYRVRLVGYRGAASARVPVYLRWLPGGFKAAPDELGKLGTHASGALIALLGTADPEIVCLPGKECLVKRLSGWKRASAPPDLSQLAISGGAGFAIAGQRLLRLDGDWVEAGAAGSWQRANALFVDGPNVWVAESDRDLIHRFAGTSWQVEASRGSRPRAIFGIGSSAQLAEPPAPVWVASDAGLARFDGEWSRVSELGMKLVALAGRVSDEVWAGGSEGLFRVRVEPAAKP